MRSRCNGQKQLESGYVMVLACSSKGWGRGEKWREGVDALFIMISGAGRLVVGGRQGDGPGRELGVLGKRNWGGASPKK